MVCGAVIIVTSAQKNAGKAILKCTEATPAALIGSVARREYGATAKGAHPKLIRKAVGGRRSQGLAIGCASAVPPN